MDDNVVRAKRAMIASASKTCLLVNHQRIGHTALHVMADLADFDVIITDSAPEPAATEQLERANINLTIASNWETT
jgi:DeoR/GlpR family transcriptional regulator of sugar metabolism